MPDMLSLKGVNENATAFTLVQYGGTKTLCNHMLKIVGAMLKMLVPVQLLRTEGVREMQMANRHWYYVYLGAVVKAHFS